MFWENFVVLIIPLAFYLLVLYRLSMTYMEFIKKGKVSICDAVILAILLMLVICVCVNLVLSSLSNLLILFLLSILSIFALMPVILKEIRRRLTIERALKDATPVEYELDGKRIRLYIYKGPYINAFYHLRNRNIYVHEELFKILTRDELNAVIWHELKHREQSAQRVFLLLRSLALVAITFWILGGLILIIMTGYLLYTFLINIVVGKLLSELLTMLSFFISLYLIASTISIILTYENWVWEHVADLYAARNAGTESFARALVKTYLVGYLYKYAKYIKPGNSAINVRLDNTPPLTRSSVFKELLFQALLARGFLDAIIKPLEETHPPLHLRLRVIKTMHR